MCRALALVSHWLHIHHQPAGRHEGRVTGTPVQGAQETAGGSGQKPSSAPGDALRRLPPPHLVSHAGRVHEAQTSPAPPPWPSPRGADVSAPLWEVTQQTSSTNLLHIAPLSTHTANALAQALSYPSQTAVRARAARRLPSVRASHLHCSST